MRKPTAKKKNIDPGTGVEPAQSLGVTGEERRQLIATAAFLRAERRGFAPGAELEDWLEAEAEVDKMLGKGGARQINQSKEA